MANRKLLKDALARLAPATSRAAGLPELPAPTPIDEQTGVGVDATVAPTPSGGRGITLGAATTTVLTSSDGVFTLSGVTRSATLADGSTAVFWMAS